MREGCPGCGSTDIARRRRRGILAQVRATFGLWPYRCLDCGKRFLLRQRYPPQQPVTSSTMEPDWGSRDRAQSIGFQAEYRTDPMQPIATIVVHADSHDQLDSILLALSRAISAEQRGQPNTLSASEFGCRAYHERINIAEIVQAPLRSKRTMLI